MGAITPEQLEAALTALVAEGAPTRELRGAARSDGTRTLREGAVGSGVSPSRVRQSGVMNGGS